MDIRYVNSTIIHAIEALQQNELELLWEYIVPSPHEMHRKHGMALPGDFLKVPSPGKVAPRKTRKAKPEKVALQNPEIDAAYAKAHAVKSEDQFGKTFDSLKPKQTIWVSYSAVMSMTSKDFRPVTVGRKSRSKKYGVTTIALLEPGQTKSKPPGIQTKLMKKRDGKVYLALGDMGGTLHGIYVPK